MLYDIINYKHFYIDNSVSYNYRDNIYIILFLRYI
jgi:hypothetical protein